MIRPYFIKGYRARPLVKQTECPENQGGRAGAGEANCLFNPVGPVYLSGKIVKKPLRYFDEKTMIIVHYKT